MIIIALVAGIIFFFGAAYNVPSNFEFFYSQDGTLLIQDSGGWTELSEAELKGTSGLVLDEPLVQVRAFKTRRSNYGLIHRFGNWLSPNKIYIFEFDPSNAFAVYADVERDLKPLTSRQVVKKAGFDYCVNTSFYGRHARPQGEIVIKGTSYGKRNPSATGFFKVIDGKPYAGAPGALFSRVSGKVEYSCQAYPSVMGNGALWDYIENESHPTHRERWKKKTYRNLIGITEGGNLVNIVSGNGALLSVREVALVARQYGLVHASLFDGGRALQYRYKHGAARIHFSALNNWINLGPKLTQKSSVYMGVKLMKE